MKRCSFQKRFLSKFLRAITRRGVRPSQKITSTRRVSWKEPLKISFQLILKSQYKFITRASWKHMGFAYKKRSDNYMPWKSIFSSWLQLNEDNKHWFWVTSLPTGTWWPRKLKTLKEKKKKKKKRSTKTSVNFNVSIFTWPFANRYLSN